MKFNSSVDRHINWMYTFMKDHHQGMATNNTLIPVVRSPTVSQCSKTERQCQNGACIKRIELCPEEQLMNQNTIMIMIIVGLAIVIFLVALYCFQQRQRRANRQYETEGYTDGCDNEHLYAPPPTYNEVIQTNLYPPTPEQLRVRQISEEPSSPMTPPPTYNSALLILARSAESLLQHKPVNKRLSVLSRRSLSMDVIEIEQTSPPKQESAEADGHPTNDWKSKSRNIFRFSRQFSKPGHIPSHSDKDGSGHHCQSILITPPPYPQTPPIYPLTPPPPCTPQAIDPFSVLATRDIHLQSENRINLSSISGSTFPRENVIVPRPIEPVDQSSMFASNVFSSGCNQHVQGDGANEDVLPYSDVPSVAFVGNRVDI